MPQIPDYAETYTDLPSLLRDVNADPEMAEALKALFKSLQVFGPGERHPKTHTFVRSIGNHLVTARCEDVLPDLCPVTRGWIGADEIFHLYAIIPAPTHVVAALGVKLGTLTNKRLKLATARHASTERSAEAEAPPPKPSQANGADSKVPAA